MNKPYFNEKKKKHKWWGIDLDGTLAEYHGFNHEKGLTYIGDPIPRMVERVKQMLVEGKDVRIFTARIGELALSINPDVTKTEVIEAIQKWCLEHIGKYLVVTCMKDYGMVELWDDRCVQVVPNTGERINQDSPRANYSICSKCKGKEKHWSGWTQEEYDRINQKLLDASIQP